VKITVYFKPNTGWDYGVRLIVNVPFLGSRGKSVPIRTTYSDDTKQTIYKIEIFIPDRLVGEVPEFFIGELQMLSPQIESVERAT